jgi:hypothetical protein
MSDPREHDSDRTQVIFKEGSQVFGRYTLRHCAAVAPALRRAGLRAQLDGDSAVGTGRYPWGEQWPPPRGAGNYSDETA